MSTIVKLGCLSALQVLGLSLAASIFWSCLPMVIYVGLYVPTGLSQFTCTKIRLCIIHTPKWSHGDGQTNKRMDKWTNKQTSIYSISRDKLSLPEGSLDFLAHSSCWDQNEWKHPWWWSQTLSFTFSNGTLVCKFIRSLLCLYCMIFYNSF